MTHHPFPTPAIAAALASDRMRSAPAHRWSSSAAASAACSRPRAARRARRITLIDRRNFHLFQPLLYQVATGALSPADIASPLRAILSARRNVRGAPRRGHRVDLDVPPARAGAARDGDDAAGRPTTP